MVNVLIVAYSLMAAIIGAGFASGQEMLLYFACFGRYGIIGIVVTVVFFGIFIFAVLNICLKRKITEYDKFLDIFSSRIHRTAVKVITLLFSFAVYGAMLSAAGEILYDIFGIQKALGTLLCTIGAVILFTFADEAVFTMNGILGIALVIVITFCVLYMLSYREFHAFSPQYVKSAGNGLIYSGYNLVSLIPVIVALSKKLKNRSDSPTVAVCVAIMSAFIMSLIFGLLAIYAGKVNLGELPMLTLAKRQNPAFATLYASVLTVAIITTLISSGGGLCNALRIQKKPLRIAFMSSLAYLLSGLGFSNLVNTAYRVCGIAGFIVCIAVVFACFSKKNIK
ncbi:MAG: hypothetical protein IJC09_00665 [Clostridia bacterium]|nr:hypothetical protein [Clostridia bacterium]